VQWVYNDFFIKLLARSRLALLSKLSLFSGNQSSWDDQPNGLLKGFKGQYELSKRKTAETIIWDVFAEYSALESWLNEMFSEDNESLPSFDYILWPNNHQQAPKLLVFDMDSTFIQIEVIDELATRHGVGESVSEVTEAAMRGELDFAESLISRVACLKGLVDSTIDDISHNLPLSKGVDQLVDICKTQDVKIAVVSGGFTPFVSHLQQTMGLYRVKANDLEIANGELTGRVLGSIVDANAKAMFVNELKDELNLNRNEIMTIGDGANDLVMMAETGFNLAYRAKPAVQAQSKGRMNITDLNQLVDIFDWSN